MATTAATKDGQVTAQQTEVFSLPPLEIKVVDLYIVGDSELITHAWSEKAKRQMREKQQRQATAARAAKDPDAEYQAAFYRTADGQPALQAIAFKNAAVQAASQIKSLTKVFLRGTFHVVGDLVPIDGEPYMREDMVRVGMGTADIRYRPGFLAWSTTLRVRFNSRVISLEQLVQLFDQAGFSVGVGEWRPEKDGHCGMFHVESLKEVA